MNLVKSIKKPYDVIIVGAGISGCVIAERFASQKGKNVLVIDKRNHVGGNCYDYYDKGILVSKYGAHIFHTKYDDVWEYVNRFSKWFDYEHRVLSFVDNKLVPIPVNIKTVNTLLGLNIKSEPEMNAWLEKNTIKNSNPKNGEEAALACVGKYLYEKMFKNYTKKQWDLYPHELDASVLNRIPVRNNHHDRYNSDKYEALPSDGYAKLFESMLSNKKIDVLLNTDYSKIKSKLPAKALLFFSGPIDEYFSNLNYDKLPYRAVRFSFEKHNVEYYQSNSVINYPNDYEYTRIVEYKHFHKINCPYTVISKEYTCWDAEPCYPVPNPKNSAIYEKYYQKGSKLVNKGVFFIGRLGNYKYINMDQAFKDALDLFNNNF
jgi:UDP-galactopyranose mutase